ncbi:hypothetical protein [Streptomyces sp. NPDC058579]|uniref:hypothetical protein n=1 Tax=Streptomyces sp. NPDC058579 TaxID=3346548 RepID=UPI003667D180
MHADVHLLLHDLRAAELRAAAELHTAASASTEGHSLPRTPVRAQLGWTLVELGLRLAVPGTGRPATTCTATLAA